MKIQIVVVGLLVEQTPSTTNGSALPHSRLPSQDKIGSAEYCAK